jgi:hypothetical protein
VNGRKKPRAGADTTPNAFAFSPVVDAELSTVTTSNVVTISGTDAAAAVSVTGLEYSLDGGSTWTDLPGTIQPAGTLQLRDTSSNLNSTTVSGTVTVGGVTVSWSVRTKDAVAPTGTLVTTLAGLLSEVAGASGGDVIRVAPGNYAFCLVRNMAFASEVIIEAADPSDPPVFAGFRVEGSTHVTVSGITAIATGVAGGGIYAQECSDLLIENCLVHGADTDSTLYTGVGIYVRLCTDVTLSGNECKWLGHGMTHIECDGLTIEDNHLHHVRVDCCRGGGSINVIFRRNKLHDSKRLEAEHPDGVQFWTSNVTHPITNILIEDNLYYRGDGSPAQGIFIKDEAGVGYDGITIRGNGIIGGLANGIFIDAHATVRSVNILIEDNFVCGWTDQSCRLILRNCGTNTVVQNNEATTLSFSLNNIPAVTVSGNTLISPVPAVGDMSLLTAWLVDHPDVPTP